MTNKPRQNKPKSKKIASSNGTSYPKSVAHYTSIEVLYALLKNYVIKDNKPIITFHLSLITEMNDKDEGRLLYEVFFKNKDNKIYTTLWKSIEQTKQHFVFPTIDTPFHDSFRGILPMWKMYGNDCNGVMIRFNYDKLKQFCESNNYILCPCWYEKKRIKRYVKEKTEELKNCANAQEIIEEVFRQNSFTKKEWWAYEKEWRILVSLSSDSTEIHKKITTTQIKQFYELQIPLDCIDLICFGPRVKKDKEQHKKFINDLLCNILGKTHCIDIRYSTIGIR